jgi:DNA-binding transcriptional regulator GbsR (MarR family)
MKKSFTDSENNIIIRLGSIIEKIGLEKSAGIIFGTLLFSEAPLSIKKISELTEIELEKVKSNLELLQNYGLSKKINNELYVFNDSFLNSIDFMDKIINNDLKDVINELNNIKTNSKIKQKKIESVNKTYNKFSRLFNFSKKMHSFKNKLF